MKKILIYIAAVLMAFACKDPYLNTPYTHNLDNFPAATYIEMDSQLNVSIWVDLLKKADLFNAMNLQANYTCFVPSNEAMQAYLSGRGMSSVDQMDKSWAETLVRFHTVRGAKYSAVDFTNGLLADSTASGDYLATNFTTDGGRVIVNEESQIQKTIQVTNAYIHIIDKVMTPVTETLWDKLQISGFSILKDGFESIGLKDRLNTVVSFDTLSSGQLIARKFRYTLFAVPDSVFNNAGIYSLTDLKDSLKAGDDLNASVNALNRYLNYHLLNQQYSFSDLSNFAETDKTRSRNYNTMATNQLLNVSEKNKEIFLNWNSSLNTGTALVRLNENCKNGVMHVIDGLLPVVSPKSTQVRWEITDFAELSYIHFYRKSSSSSTQQYNLAQGDLSCYKWLSVPEFKTGLTYELSNKNESVKIKALNADYLILSLGTFGWVEMKSPAIISGSYSVYLEHFNPKGTEASGKLLFILDGNYFGSQLTSSGASKTTDQYLKTKIGEVTFSETTTHTLRILAGDEKSSYIDCITFTPK